MYLSAFKSVKGQIASSRVSLFVYGSFFFSLLEAQDTEPRPSGATLASGGDRMYCMWLEEKQDVT